MGGIYISNYASTIIEKNSKIISGFLLDTTFRALPTFVTAILMASIFTKNKIQNLVCNRHLLVSLKSNKFLKPNNFFSDDDFRVLIINTYLEKYCDTENIKQFNASDGYI